jgi:hypothetical protein
LEHIDSVPTVSCRAGGVVVPELGEAKEIAYFKKKAGK